MPNRPKLKREYRDIVPAGTTMAQLKKKLADSYEETRRLKSEIFTASQVENNCVSAFTQACELLGLKGRRSPEGVAHFVDAVRTLQARCETSFQNANDLEFYKEALEHVEKVMDVKFARNYDALRAFIGDLTRRLQASRALGEANAELELCAMDLKRANAALDFANKRIDEMTPEDLVHVTLSTPFAAACGADEPNQRTTVIVAHSNCLRCLRVVADVKPVPMILTCPLCNGRHIDEGDFATKPHHTHACQHCGIPWRPALVATVGVQFLPGFKN